MKDSLLSCVGRETKYCVLQLIIWPVNSVTSKWMSVNRKTCYWGPKSTKRCRKISSVIPRGYRIWGISKMMIGNRRKIAQSLSLLRGLAATTKERNKWKKKWEVIEVWEASTTTEIRRSSWMCSKTQGKLLIRSRTNSIPQERRKLLKKFFQW